MPRMKKFLTMEGMLFNIFEWVVHVIYWQPTVYKILQGTQDMTPTLQVFMVSVARKMWSSEKFVKYSKWKDLKQGVMR